MEGWNRMNAQLMAAGIISRLGIQESTLSGLGQEAKGVRPADEGNPDAGVSFALANLRLLCEVARINEWHPPGPIDLEAVLAKILGRMALMDEWESRLIRMRFGMPPFDLPMTLQAVGETLGWSHAKVHRVEKSALAKLWQGDRDPGSNLDPKRSFGKPPSARQRSGSVDRLRNGQVIHEECDHEDSD